MILYIHGFGSSGKGAKALKLREYYHKQTFLAPTLSHIPYLAIETLQEIIEYALHKGEEVSLIGSSLGGFMAIYLSHRYNLKAVLINPSTKPTQTLNKALGLTHHYYDLSQFEWNNQHLKMLERYTIKKIDASNFLLLVQKGDETIDYQEAVKLFKDSGIDPSQMIIQEGGTHAFENIESKFRSIDHFFTSKQ